jgi:Putative MetA-pathway of phenol degradation
VYVKQTGFFWFGFVAIFVIIATGFSARAAEEKSSVKGSDYTLFNPVPDVQLRDFSTDRPGKSHSSKTVDAGHFQIESDFVIYTRDPGGDDRPSSRSYSVGTPIFKFGVNDSIDIEVATAVFNYLSQSGGGSPPLVARGFGDTAVGAKINLFGNDSGNQSLALLPFVKFPTAAPNIGNGFTEFMLNAPYTIDAKPWSLTLEPNFGILRDSTNTGYRENYGFIANLNRSFFSEKLIGAIEVAADFSSEAGSEPKVSIDPSLQYLLTRDLQLDVGIYIGANRATPRYIAYTGISYRY